MNTVQKRGWIWHSNSIRLLPSLPFCKPPILKVLSPLPSTGISLIGLVRHVMV